MARKNVELTLANIRKDSPVLAELASNGTIKMTGAIYNLQTGVGDGVDGAPGGIERAKMVVVTNPSEGKPSMGKSIKNASSVTRVGLDLAKNVFQVHAVDANGEVVVARKVRRGELIEFFAELPRVPGGDGGVLVGASLGAPARRTRA